MSWKNGISWERWRVCYFRSFESVCLNRWVLAPAAIGLKTTLKKTYTILFAEGNTTDTWDTGKPQTFEFQRATAESEITPSQLPVLLNSSHWWSEFYNWSPVGEWLYSGLCHCHIYINLIPKLMLSLIFGQTDYTDKTFRLQTFHLEFHYHKEENCWRLQIASLWWKGFIKVESWS